MLEHQNKYESSFLVRGDQPLVGGLTEEEGVEVVRYFLEEESAESAISTGVPQVAERHRCMEQPRWGRDGAGS